jgi:ParB-like chromosome segregation protein Spo0J
MEIKMVKVEDLKPYVNNPRLNDDAVEYVANSIKQFGFKVPMVIDKDNVIVAGHTRFKASLELGLKEVPCIIADDLNEEQIKAFRLADNKVSEKSSWNFELLQEELEDLDIDMSGFGFNLDIEEEFDEENLDDEREKEKINVSIVFDKYEDFEKVKKELEETSKKGNGNMSIKMI